MDLAWANRNQWQSVRGLENKADLAWANRNRWQSERGLENKVDLAWANRNRWQGVRGPECKVHLGPVAERYGQRKPAVVAALVFALPLSSCSTSDSLVVREDGSIVLAALHRR